MVANCVLDALTGLAVGQCVGLFEGVRGDAVGSLLGLVEGEEVGEDVGDLFIDENRSRVRCRYG